jgi:signal transduction histidine kinase
VISFENESRVAYISSELGNLQAILKRLDISKSAFVSVAAHEFKTPLTLVEGYAAMLDELVSADSEQMRPLLLGIHNGISRLRDLVDDMIDISLLDNNIMKFNFQPMRLIRMLNFLNNDFQPALTKRKQTLDIRQFNGADEMLYFDSKRIYQALSNIISNAIKFTPDCGKITIDGRIMPGFIELTIADTGIGISIENQDSIFEKFGQLGSPSLHSSGKTKFKGGGPGLGLPIAKGIIQGHGGSIWVESDDYDEIRCPGSIFHILLPLSPLTGHPNLVELPKKPKPSSKRPPKLKK